MILIHRLLKSLERVDAFSQDTTEPILDEADLQALAESPEAIRALIDVARDEAVPLTRRYAAAEAIAQSGSAAVVAGDAAAARALAIMLASALPRDEFHNRWGLPGHFVGSTGQLLLALGPAAHEALPPLLDNATPLRIIGSQAATTQDARRYRICDLASYLLATSLGVPWHNDPDPAERDRLNRPLRH